MVFGLVVVGAFCGFSTAVFLRYLNVLLKEFAHSAEMLLTAVLTAIFFGAPLTVNVLISIFLVAIAIYLYNQPTQEKKNLLPGGLAYFFFLYFFSFFHFLFCFFFLSLSFSLFSWLFPLFYRIKKVTTFCSTSTFYQTKIKNNCC